MQTDLQGVHQVAHMQADPLQLGGSGRPAAFCRLTADKGRSADLQVGANSQQVGRSHEVRYACSGGTRTHQKHGTAGFDEPWARRVEASGVGQRTQQTAAGC